MSDPAVCCFLTKTLCANGGELELPELRRYIGLSAQQLEETLWAAGPQRFLVLREDGGARVLALSGVRLCVRKECGGCERLHLCKLHLMGRCNLGVRSCKYSHDILSAENKKVLKTHELSGLDENELRVLLLQNDPFLLPDACQFYNRKDDICIQQNHCNKLHICRHFLQGECRFSLCKKSHDLLDGHSLRVLETGGIDGSIASNIQTIYDHRHEEFKKELKKGKIHNYKPRENLWKKPAVTRGKEQCGVGPTLHVPLSEGPGSNVPGQSQQQLPTGAESKNEAKENDSSARASKNNKEEKSDEICVFYIWRYCKHKDKCKFVHYHLPYRWQVHNGINWNDISMMEEIEEAYCDPKNISVADKNIDFQRMTCSSSSLRRLSTPSSVSKPTLTFTTQWIWYWKNNQGQWVEYGEELVLIRLVLMMHTGFSSQIPFWSSPWLLHRFNIYTLSLEICCLLNYSGSSLASLLSIVLLPWTCKDCSALSDQMLPFPLGGQILFERVISLKNAGKEISKKSLLPLRQLTFPRLVYGIAAQMAEHKGDPGMWKSTQGTMMDIVALARVGLDFSRQLKWKAPPSAYPHILHCFVH